MPGKQISGRLRKPPSELCTACKALCASHRYRTCVSVRHVRAPPTLSPTSGLCGRGRHRVSGRYSSSNIGSRPLSERRLCLGGPAHHHRPTAAGRAAVRRREAAVAAVLGRQVVLRDHRLLRLRRVRVLKHHLRNGREGGVVNDELMRHLR